MPCTASAHPGLASHSAPFLIISFCMCVGSRGISVRSRTMGHVSKYQHQEWERVCVSVCNYQTVSRWFSWWAGQGARLGVEGGFSVCVSVYLNTSKWIRAVGLQGLSAQGTAIRGIHIMYVRIFPTGGSSSWSAGRGNRVMLCCVCMHKCHCQCCFLELVCIFVYNACLMFVHVCLLGIHTQSCHWLDLGTYSNSSSSSFTLLGMPDSANPYSYGISKCRLRN